MGGAAGGEWGEEWVLESLVWAGRAGSAGIPPLLGLCLRARSGNWEIIIPPLSSEHSLRDEWFVCLHHIALKDTKSVFCFRLSSFHHTQKLSRASCAAQAEGTFLLARDCMVHRILKECLSKYSKISSHTKLRYRVHLWAVKHYISALKKIYFSF